MALATAGDSPGSLGRNDGAAASIGGKSGSIPDSSNYCLQIYHHKGAPAIFEYSIKTKRLLRPEEMTYPQPAGRGWYQAGDLLWTSFFERKELVRLFPELDEVFDESGIPVWQHLLVGFLSDFEPKEYQVQYRIQRIEKYAHGDGLVELKAFLVLGEAGEASGELTVIELERTLRDGLNEFRARWGFMLGTRGLRPLKLFIDAFFSLGITVVGGATGAVRKTVGKRALTIIVKKKALKMTAKRVLALRAVKMFRNGWVKNGAKAITAGVQAAVTDILKGLQDQPLREKLGNGPAAASYKEKLVRDALRSGIAAAVKKIIDETLGKELKNAVSEGISGRIAQEVALRITTAGTTAHVKACVDAITDAYNKSDGTFRGFSQRFSAEFPARLMKVAEGLIKIDWDELGKVLANG
jgi:hypothetical protein